MSSTRNRALSDERGGMSARLPVSVVIPTYRREIVLVETIEWLLRLDPRPAEILVLDQTEKHQEAVEVALRNLENARVARVIRLTQPSIPCAMNKGLCEATQEFVLFVDDDIVPELDFVGQHASAFERTGAALIAGRVLQPWHKVTECVAEDSNPFASMQAGWVNEFMGGNFAVRREVALGLGGFDEQFRKVAYNFEAEFAHRATQAGYKIFYEPRACIHHLKAGEGGTRAFGSHLRSVRPDHAVGAYYYLLRTWSGWHSLARLALRPLRAIATRHHLRQPWWIPATLLAELSGILWAVVLVLQGPRYLGSKRLPTSTASHD
jgi:GT2 family glycosyltransferase